MNSKYFQEFFGESIGPSKGDKSRGGGLNRPCDLEK